jgi:adenylosuccinate synthase
VDEVVLVIRAFPIRVAGNSGALPKEIDWDTVTQESGSPVGVVEYTSVTRVVRRVARFSADIVRGAIAVNNPTKLVLNHLDYVDYVAGQLSRPTPRVALFVRQVTSSIGRAVDYFGFGPASVVPSRQVETRQLA